MPHKENSTSAVKPVLPVWCCSSDNALFGLDRKRSLAIAKSNHPRRNTGDKRYRSRPPKATISLIHACDDEQHYVVASYMVQLGSYVCYSCCNADLSVATYKIANLKHIGCGLRNQGPKILHDSPDWCGFSSARCMG